MALIFLAHGPRAGEANLASRIFLASMTLLLA
jgi:hypothetical protein